MWNNFKHKLRLIWQDLDLRKRILFVFFMLVLFRLGTNIPIPGVDTLALERFFSGNQFFGLLNVFSGGGLSNLSVFMLGVGPFITGSIIMQLLTMMIPALKAMYHEEGEAGRRKFVYYSRLITVPLAALQGLALLTLLENQGVIIHLSGFGRLVNVVTVVTGSLLLMWVGELISQYGIGNGVSLLIFAGIVAGIPSTISQVIVNFEVAQMPIYLAFLVVAVIVIAGVVVITEAERPIPITYAKQVRGQRVYGGMSTYLPLRLNQAGVMPIIFALSILLFPQMIINFLTRFQQPIISTVSSWLLGFLNNPWTYGLSYFVLVFGFTYFYSAVTFDPEAVSGNLQKSGAFIPGIRPGRPTAEHLSRVLSRLTLVGAVFLGLVAMLPLILRAVTGISALAIGGTALLIVVSVALEFVKQIDAQIAMREY